MYPVSDAFLAALRAPSMVVVTSIESTWGDTLAISNGSVDMDSRRSTQRTASLELVPTGSLSLDQVYELVMSPGAEFRISRGLLVNGTAELVPLGVFSTDSATKPSDRAGVISWNGSDRSKKIERARLTNSFVMNQFEGLGASIGRLLDDRWTPVEYDFSNVSEAFLSQVLIEGGSDSNPWASARTIMAAFGYDLAFDGAGIARATPIPDPIEVDSVFDFGSGESNLMTGGQTQGSFDATYNGVIVTAENTGTSTPVRGEAWDTNVNSPTYYLGAYGRVPYFESSSILTTAAQCEKAAQTILARVIGRNDGFAWPAVVMPALTPLDVVNVSIGSSTARYVLDKVTIPLRASDEMNATARVTGA